MEPGVLIALIAGAASIIGGIVTLVATRGKAKVDAKAKLDARIDERVGQQLEAAWKEIDTLARQNKEQAAKIEHLQAHAETTERREILIYRHTRALREHIIKQLPPPPPPMPEELVKWFSQFENDETQDH